MTYPVFRDALLESVLEEMVNNGEITKDMADKLRKKIYEKPLIWMVNNICPDGPEVPDLEPEA